MSNTAETINDNAEVTYIPISSIRSNPYQPRKAFDRELLLELADSIKEYGIMQPVSVRRNGDKYELVAGERRLRAARLAGKESVPAIIIEISERDSAFLALMENLQRENLNFLEEAEGYLNLMQDYGLTQEEVAAKIGKSQSNIANKVRVLKLPEEIKKALSDNGLTERHARALLKIPEPELQMKALGIIISDRMNVKSTDDYVEGLLLKMSKGAKKGRKQDKKSNHKFYIKDMKIYTNTIKKAVGLINEAGGNATYSVSENDDTVEVVVSIKKP